MTHELHGLLTKWTSAAAAVPADKAKLDRPVSVLQTEALVASRFVSKHWKAQHDTKKKVLLRPGLELAVRKTKKGDAPAGVYAGIGDELVELEQVLGSAQAQWLLASKHGPAELVTRAEFVLEEIAATLEHFLDDGVEDDDDAKLAAVQHEHQDDGHTPGTLASALEDYATLGEEHRDELDGFGGFDVALLDEAPELAAALRAQPGLTEGPADAEASAALLLRNQVATLLWDRLGRVRGAARFVFRHNPEVVREVTSVYDRRKRVASRRKALLKKHADAGAAPTPTATATATKGT